MNESDIGNDEDNEESVYESNQNSQDLLVTGYCREIESLLNDLNIIPFNHF